MISGNIEKMITRLNGEAQYQLPVGESRVDMNQYLGKKISLHYTGTINCVHCGSKTKKSYSQGYCYPCMIKLAECDMCIVKPETCHFDQGTCREPDWAMTHCMQPHYVYLSNSSGIKVGITRATQIPTRWIDQGAVQALPIAKAQTRYQVGLMEVAIKSQVMDKTDWRKMLKNQVEAADLAQKRDEIFQACQTDIRSLQQRFGEDAIELMPDEETVTINYPVLEYPEKIKAINLDKTPDASGILMGIKGQYLIFDIGVINVRKYTGYEILFSAE